MESELPERPASGTPQVPEEDPDEDDENTEQPLTMAQSVVLTSLPQNAHAALEGAGELAQAKVTVRFQPVGNAPPLRQRVFKITSTQSFATVVASLRKKLGIEPSQSVFCYVNSIFAPGLDEAVGNLWRCFKTGDELVVAYAMMPAFG